jgi:hypothetical protein
VYIVQILSRSGSGLLDLGLREYSLSLNERGGAASVKRESRSACFGAKMVPRL